MALRSSSSNATAANPLVITAPAGIVDDDILVVWAMNDGSSNVFTWPSGFTERINISSTADGSTVGVATKLAASESGDYSIPSQNGNIIGGMACFSGRHTTDYFHRSGSAVNNTANASPWTMTSGAFGGGNTSGECDIIVVGISDVISGVTVDHVMVTSGYTELHDLGSAGRRGFMAYKEAQASGFDGVVSATGTGSTTAGWAIAAIALLTANTPANPDDFVKVLVKPWTAAP